MKVISSLAVCAALVGLAGSQASAASFTFDLSGFSVTGGYNAMFPSALTHNFGIAGVVTSIDFDVNYTSFDPSWNSEVILGLDTDNGFDDIFMEDYGATDDPGAFSASGTFLTNLDSSDGMVFLTPYEAFNDPEVAIDSQFGAGSTVTFNFTPVPAPSGLAVMAIPGMIGMGIMLRRRRR